MKKTSRIVAVVLAALLVVAAVVVLAACNKEGTDVAYGLVHGKGYVAKVTVTAKGNTVVDADINEACLPTQVAAAEADGEHTVSVEVTSHGATSTKHYYKTVKWGSVTATYDATDGYKVGSQTLVEFFANEDNCKAYFEAVAANEVTVVTSAGNKTDIMNAASLLKTQNGYWSGDNYPLGWKGNVKATIDYVKENGLDNLVYTQNDDGEWIDENGVNTGATWTDMGDYLNLLLVAKYRANGKDVQVVTGECSYTVSDWYTTYGAKVDVYVSNGKIVAIKLYADSLTGWHRTTESWTEGANAGDLGYDKTEAAYAQWLSENFIGQKVKNINKIEVTVSSGSVKSDSYTATVSEDDIDWAIAGATQSSARVIAAIQNALSKLA